MNWTSEFTRPATRCVRDRRLAVRRGAGFQTFFQFDKRGGTNEPNFEVSSLIELIYGSMNLDGAGGWMNIGSPRAGLTASVASRRIEARARAGYTGGARVERVRRAFFVVKFNHV